MREKVVSLDPGKTTGICVGTIEDRKLTFRADQAEMTELELWLFLARAKPIHLIYEEFTFRQGKLGVDYTPANLIGVIKLYVQFMRCQIYPQLPVIGEGGKFKDSKLKDAGYWTVGKVHGRSATRHLLQWAFYRAGYALVDKVELLK